MSHQKSIRTSLVFLFALSVSGSALADETARVGYRGSIAGNACTPAVVSNASYRDHVARLGTPAVGVQAAKGSNGYRDAYARTNAEATARRVALAGTACRY